MALPEPAFNFTIPSIHDDTPLDCRIYAAFFNASTTGSSTFFKKGAVIAHPYASMGGSYDDHVVAMIASELLKEGFVVGTFNFRGAHSSKGRTSWTGKPELDDYISFAGFLIHYLYLLRPPSLPATTAPTNPSASTLSIEGAQLKEKNKDEEKTLIILGGYSYGSLITKHLPPTPQILSFFSLPRAGSAAAEILLRAHTLSTQSNRDLEDALLQCRQKKHSHEHHYSLKMGGEETSPDLRRSSRSSREFRRSSERSRSIDLPHSIHWLSLRRKRRDERTLAVINSHVADSRSTSRETESLIAVSTAYLLVSTILPPLSTLLIPAIGHKFWNKPKDHAENIVLRPTLAVFGDHDTFISARKGRSWADKLKAEPLSRFEYQEVADAGHFWHEEGVELELRNAVQRWVQGIQWD